MDKLTLVYVGMVITSTLAIIVAILGSWAIHWVNDETENKKNLN